MTDIDIAGQSLPVFTTEPTTFSVEDTYWGYIVRSNRRPALHVMIAQFVCYFLGACFLTAAIGLWLVPSMIADGNGGGLRMGASVLFGALAAYLLWFASRGTRAELHVDTSLGEIREVIANRAGRPTTVGAYGFDAIGGIFMEQQEDDELCSLVLRYRNTAQTVSVAEGIEAQLISLRDRLGRDLMVEPRAARRNVA